MKFAVKALATIAAMMVINPLWAETHTFEAITDFTDIDAGEVPYYRHNGVNALAINAAIEDFRDKFARATLVFEQESGLYDVTITSLGETDGDGTFRFLINGEVVGSSVNAPTDIDFSEQLHTFENISIPQGALIGVESIAVSNGLIPEGDAYAYARGRWTTLTLSDVEEVVVVPDPVENVDLGLALQVDNDTPVTGEEISIDVTVENFSGTTATNPIATVTFSGGIGNPVSDACVVSGDNSMTCTLVELTGNDETGFTITATALTAGDAQVTAVINADQPDPDTGNNSDSDGVEIQSAKVPVIDNTVDLELTLTSDKERIEVGDSIAYTVTLINVHESNTATSPTAGITLPASLQFEAGSTCTANELAVFCETEELPPGASTEVTFSARAVGVDSNSTILATASSAQTESNVANNETEITTEVSPKPVQNAVTPTEQQTGNVSTPEPTGTSSNAGTSSTAGTLSTSSSGGGALQPTPWLLLMIASVLYSRRRCGSPTHR